MTAVAERAASPLHVPYAGGDPVAALRECRGVIEHAITHHPRSLQTAIGPSEIGTPCDHCLAAKLAGWQETERGIPWLPTIGTAVHAWIEEAFITSENRRGAQHQGGLRYLTEARVMVGYIDGRPIWGSTDLLDLLIGMTIDWKIVGASTLTSAKGGPKPGYRVQAHLYARGWNLAGYRVDHVAIAYLPRNAVSLDSAIWWHEPYDERIAVAALERATGIARNLKALATISADAVDAWITALPRDAGCYDCARFPDAPTTQRRRDNVLDDLLTP